MLEKCRRDQWTVDDLDWSGRAAGDAREKDEIAIVQYFTDMAGIERLAGALFAEQARRDRRSGAARDLRDVRRATRCATPRSPSGWRATTTSTTTAATRARRRSTTSGRTSWRRSRDASPEIANGYITAGELMLDVALLRSLNDYVARRDEPAGDGSRSIATSRGTSRSTSTWSSTTRPTSTAAALQRRAAAVAACARPRRLGHRQRAVVRVPVLPGGLLRRRWTWTDPSGRALARGVQADPAPDPEADVSDELLRSGHAYPASRVQRPADRAARFRSPIERLAGVRPELLSRLYTEDDRRRAEHSSYADLADEALAAKFANA